MITRTEGAPRAVLALLAALLLVPLLGPMDARGAIGDGAPWTGTGEVPVIAVVSGATARAVTSTTITIVDDDQGPRR